MGYLQDQTHQDYYQGNDYGNYQFTSLDDVINQFIVAYVGEDKIISRVKRVDVAFHAQRALAELSFDTLKSCKSQEITVPASLQMILPQDYVNYTKISWVDSAGIKHLLYPTSKTSNPTNIYQDTNGEFTLPGGNPTATFTLASGVLVLDDEYPDILPGMLVKSPHVGDEVNVIYSVATDGTFTSITLRSQANTFLGTPFESLFAGTIPIEITTSDGSLHHFSSKSSSANGVTLTAGSAIMTVSAAEIANIEVGMVISMYSAHIQELYGLPLNNTVLAINGNDITMSSVSTLSSATLSTSDFNFISPNKPDSTTWSNYKSQAPSENNNDDYEDDTYWPMDGSRFGLDPQHAQANGSFYIDCVSGKIHFSSNISGKTVILDYISDSLGTDGEMQVHKFAEEAMYKWIAHAILSTRANVQEYVVNRFKKERFAAIRTAKLRLSNLKLEELTQILRGKSKQIKH